MRLPKFRCKNKTGNWCFFTVLHGGNVNEENFDLETLSQFTGLSDKQGVEIYEGDIILKQGIGKLKEVNEKSVVKIINGNTYGYYDDTDKELISNMQFPIEVIGNIYENPELLKDKQ